MQIISYYEENHTKAIEVYTFEIQQNNSNISSPDNDYFPESQLSSSDKSNNIIIEDLP
ncbi:1680_t:CDS:2 [Ambispora leptoticha]|uniref:1680_t:CDS:1 n=1 Tax=Ambispora leptoticha TaxID=144679 RepID=A0A9N9AKJ0_9GLOM|nr:1680_t:CDS:2 [Ambispora leptoticha]